MKTSLERVLVAYEDLMEFNLVLLISQDVRV